MEGITLRILMLAWAGTVVFAFPLSEGERRYRGLTSHEKSDLRDQDLGVRYDDRQPLLLRKDRYKRNNEESAAGQLAGEIHDRAIENMLNTPLFKHQTQTENEVVKRSFQQLENKEGMMKTRRRFQMNDPVAKFVTAKKRRTINAADDEKTNGQLNEQHSELQSPEGEWAEGNRGKVSERDCLPQSAEAMKVWAEGKRALVDQLKEQMKDDSSAVDDESSAVGSVQKCLQSAVAAGLEARQQTKIITLLAKNSVELIGHIDIVESVATEELAGTEERMKKFEEKLQQIRNRIANLDKELGSGNPNCRTRRISENADKPNVNAMKKQVPLKAIDGVDAPLSKMHRAATEIADMLSKTSKHNKLQQVVDRVKRSGHPVGNEAQQAWAEDKRAPANEGEQVWGEGGKRALDKDAQKVWIEGKQALMDQLTEQLNEDNSAINDEESAHKSVEKCLQSAVAAGMEARQQGKIIKLLAKNSVEMIGHIDTVEAVATEELATTETRLSKFEAKLQGIRDRIAASEQDLREASGCKAVCRHQQKRGDVFKEQLPLENLLKRGISQQTSKQQQHTKQQRVVDNRPNSS